MMPIIFEVKQWLKKVKKEEGLDVVHQKVKLFKQNLNECILVNFHASNCKIEDYLDSHISHVDAMANDLKVEQVDKGSLSVKHNQLLVSENEKLEKLLSDVIRVSIGDPVSKRRQNKQLRNIQRNTKFLKNATQDLLSEMRDMESKVKNLPQKTEFLSCSVDENSKKIKKEKKVLKPSATKSYQNMINYQKYQFENQD